MDVGFGERICGSCEKAVGVNDWARLECDGKQLLCNVDREAVRRGGLIKVVARGGGGVADANIVSRRARPRVGADIAEDGGGGTDMVRGGPDILASKLAAVVSDPPVPPDG